MGYLNFIAYGSSSTNDYLNSDPKMNGIDGDKNPVLKKVHSITTYFSAITDAAGTFRLGSYFAKASPVLGIVQVLIKVATKNEDNNSETAFSA